MGNLIIRTGDMALLKFDPPFMLLAPPMGNAKGSSTNFKVLGMDVCFAGDEGKIIPFATAQLPYMKPPYVIPGMGRFSFKLNGNITKITETSGKKLIIKGADIDVTFTPSLKAMQPPPGPGPPPQDTTPNYKGKVIFISTNLNVKAG
ncbi:hypothetical protein [Streptomyces noursei]|uniref:hypothetical protein n=1 Tax=Streptomyces noursei TaxID=1971 RepID=UPI0011AF845C|nr:hypothetical protein [Streptomyces noursei]